MIGHQTSIAKADLFGMQVEILHDMSSIEAEWHVLSAEKTSTAYQAYDWVKAAFDTFERDNKQIIAYVSLDGNPVLILPLVLESGFPSKLRWPGNNHANICCGLFSRDFLTSCPDGFAQKLFALIGEHVGGTVVLHLKNQPRLLDGFDNPLMKLPYQAGPNPLFKIDLSEGFEAVLKLGNAGRKRRLFRRQCRIADELGGYELVIPKSRDEVEFILGEFFRLKAERLKALGVQDVFQPDKARELLSRLAIEPEREGSQPLRFFVLNVDGKMRAMYGACISHNRCYSFINAVEYDQFAEESPGEMVLYLMIEHLVQEGFEYFDIGIGNERYKYSWCKEPVPLYETVYPLGFSAVPFSMYSRTLTATKERIKANPKAWNTIKQLRKIRGRLSK